MAKKVVESVVSPITGSSNVTLLERISVQQLIRDWYDAFSIDITNELSGLDEIIVYRCEDTKLIFYYPFELAGSETRYSQLSKFDWYYMPRKWEHDAAIEDLVGCRKILEVGCGQGAFIERLIREYAFEAVGIELNHSAVEVAQAKHLPVFSMNLQDFSKIKRGYFDAVCAFQVLEHISDPLGFLRNTVNAIKVGGKLILSVPNSESFTKYAENNLLDQPPHHMHRWCKNSFLSLPTMLPVKFVRFKIEPLACYHIDWYLGIQLSRLTSNKIILSLLFRLTHYVFKPVLNRFSYFRNCIDGHTLYVEFSVTEH
jgi:SAM-dependent methyltransferase